MKIIFCDNGLRGLLNFRGSVIEYYLNKGYDIVLVYPAVTHEEPLEDRIPKGCKCYQTSMIPTGMNPIKDFYLLYELFKIYKREKPNIVFNYTIKPNIYGTLAAKFVGIKSVAMVAGLGYMFNSNGLKQKIGRALYKFGLRNADKVLTLNSTIYDTLIERSFVLKNNVVLLKGGEGVDLKRFKYLDDSFVQTKFLMVARVLYDKGYMEYVEAARIVKRKYPEVIFELVGPLDVDSPMGVANEVLERDEASGAFKYLGVLNDIPSKLGEGGVVIVLPSYHEGLSMSLIEACSMGRPIITTDIPGCRETVDDGENGYLVPVKNVEKLADSMIKFIELTQFEKQMMSRKSRNKAENTFDVKYVFEVYDKIINFV